jgi:hypothetical protein
MGGKAETGFGVPLQEEVDCRAAAVAAMAHLDTRRGAAWLNITYCADDAASDNGLRSGSGRRARFDYGRAGT